MGSGFGGSRTLNGSPVCGHYHTSETGRRGHVRVTVSSRPVLNTAAMPDERVLTIYVGRPDELAAHSRGYLFEADRALISCRSCHPAAPILPRGALENNVLV